jgi:hypothetical protein
LYSLVFPWTVFQLINQLETGRIEKYGHFAVRMSGPCVAGMVAAAGVRRGGAVADARGGKQGSRRGSKTESELKSKLEKYLLTVKAIATEFARNT